MNSRPMKGSSCSSPVANTPLRTVAAHPVYTPVALLRDGTACKCLESAPEDIDIDRVRQDSPNHVGTWRKSGANCEVRWSGAAKPDLLKPDVGPPRALPGADALRGTYQRLGGGGNTALGGTMLVAAARNLTFLADGRLAQSNVATGATEAAAARSKRGTSGTWSPVGPTLTRRYGNGDIVRTCAYCSAKRKASASFGRYGVLWVGGEGYKRIE